MLVNMAHLCPGGRLTFFFDENPKKDSAETEPREASLSYVYILPPLVLSFNHWGKKPNAQLIRLFLSEEEGNKCQGSSHIT